MKWPLMVAALSRLRASFTRLKHRVQDLLQSVVLNSCRHSLLVSKLLVDLVILVVGTLLDVHINPVIRRQPQIL